MKKEKPSDVLRKVLRNQRIGVADVADTLDVHPNTVSVYISTIKTLREGKRNRLANAIGMKPDLLEAISQGKLNFLNAIKQLQTNEGTEIYSARSRKRTRRNRTL